jgi:hypothetical protein
MDESSLTNLKGLVSELALISDGSTGFRDTASQCSFEVEPARYERSRAAIERILAEETLSDYFLVNEGANSTGVVLNKAKLVSDGVIFFLRPATYLEWVSGIDTFSANSFFTNTSDKTRIIIVNGLEKEYSGPLLKLLSTLAGVDANAAVFDDRALDQIPAGKKIRERVFVLAENFVIDPKPYLLFNPDLSAPILPLVKASIESLAASLAQEIRSDKSVTIRGLRRLDIPLALPGDLDDPELLEILEHLRECVSWIHEERSDTRSKLITNRLSLDIDESESLVFGVKKYLKGALEDARERYSFVISEASDEFNKEKRSIQSEINKQLQTYGSKTRDLLASILRDTLAGLFLVGFSLFGPAKPQDIPNLLRNEYINILFKGLAIYFAISFVVQAAVIITDLIQSRSELTKYATATRNYMRPSEISSFINDSLFWRELAFAIFFAIIFGLYVVIIFFCIYFPDLAIIPTIPPVAS